MTGSVRNYFGILFFSLVAYALQAQKYGHVNSASLVDSLNETKDLIAQLSRYEKALKETGDKMISRLQLNMEVYKSEVATGKLTAQKKREMEENLEMEQDAVGKYQTNATESLENKRKELFTPLLEKIQKTINDYARSHGYLFVFDSSFGLIHQDPTYDLAPELIRILNQK
jgi:outer membrane protein